MVFWALDERRKKLTAREIDTLIDVRERLKKNRTPTGSPSLRT